MDCKYCRYSLGCLDCPVPDDVLLSACHNCYYDGDDDFLECDDDLYSVYHADDECYYDDDDLPF